MDPEEEASFTSLELKENLSFTLPITLTIIVYQLNQYNPHELVANLVAKDE